MNDGDIFKNNAWKRIRYFVLKFINFICNISLIICVKNIVFFIKFWSDFLIFNDSKEQFFVSMFKNLKNLDIL